MDDKALRECERVLGYKFKDDSILIQAFTHASSSSMGGPNNERMEFLGDAIVGMVVCKYLYLRYTDQSEGHLTRRKSAIVSRSSLGRVARDLKLDKFFILGAGMTKRRHLPNSLFANVFEAVVAAIFIDGGIDAAEEVIIRLLTSEMDAAEQNRRYTNHKSILQHHAQRHMQSTPVYRFVREEGPDHLKFFEVVVVIGDTEYESGWGRNKKEAEQRAAEETLKVLGVEATE